MDIQMEARAFVDHLQSLSGFVIVDYFDGNYEHMGATIADAILQSGLNYETVVRPRIKKIQELYPEASRTSAFLNLLNEKGAKNVLSWKDEEKPNRVVGLAKFFVSESIETENELSKWMTSDANMRRLLGVRGVGPKTADYLKILVGSQTAAVDRHVFALLEEAGILQKNYKEAREILNIAADFMGVARALFDHSIWQYMSKRKSSQKRNMSCDRLTK